MTFAIGNKKVAKVTGAGFMAATVLPMVNYANEFPTNFDHDKEKAKAVTNFKFTTLPI